MYPGSSIGPRTQRSPPDRVLGLAATLGRCGFGPRSGSLLLLPVGTEEEEEDEEEEEEEELDCKVPAGSPVPRRRGGGLKEAAYCRGPSPSAPCLGLDPLGFAIAAGAPAGCSWG